MVDPLRLLQMLFTLLDNLREKLETGDRTIAVSSFDWNRPFKQTERMVELELMKGHFHRFATTILTLGQG